MTKKYYAVVANENQNGHLLGRFSSKEEADKAARENLGRLYEFTDKPLANGEDHKIRGVLLKDYSKN